jgi:integrase
VRSFVAFFAAMEGGTRVPHLKGSSGRAIEVPHIPPPVRGETVVHPPPGPEGVSPGVISSSRMRRYSADPRIRPFDRSATRRRRTSSLSGETWLPGRSRGAARRRADPWEARIEAFLAVKRSEGEVGEAWLARMRWELRRLPRLLARVGRPVRLRHPRDVTETCLRALREGLPWETSTFAIHFQAVRQFLRWSRQPLAEQRSLWRLPSGAPVHRRWLTREQLRALYRAARGVERVIVALEGLNGLRRVEVLRLRVKDVVQEDRCLRILGKGRHGGKWRSIPTSAEVDQVLRGWVLGRRDEDRVVPLSRSGADNALQRAARRAGFPAAGLRVSHHDLRRTFGRLANASGMNLVSLQGMFGHASPGLSAHYIGLDLEELRGALGRLESYLGPLEDGPPDGSSPRVPRSEAPDTRDAPGLPSA